MSDRTYEVDGTCCKEHADRGTYKMIGRCFNCGLERIEMTFVRGDEARTLDCPRCGCRTVHAQAAE